MTPKTQSVCKHCGRPIKNGEYCRRHRNAEPSEPSPERSTMRYTHPEVAGQMQVNAEAAATQPSAEPPPVVEYKNRFGVMAPDCAFGCDESQYDQRCNIHRPAAPQPVSGDAPLRISFDIGGVLSKYPEVFRPMVDALQRGGAEVFVITDMHEHEKSVRFVRENGYDIPAERILNSDYTAHGEGCKAETIKQHSIKVHLDDFAGYCAHTECVNLFVWPNPTKPYYADDFKTDGTEGDFGRRKAAKI